MTHVHEVHKKMLASDIIFRNVDSERIERLEDQGKTAYDPFIFISLYGESTMELSGSWNHNEHWNTFGESDHMYKIFKGISPPQMRMSLVTLSRGNKTEM